MADLPKLPKKKTDKKDDTKKMKVKKPQSRFQPKPKDPGTVKFPGKTVEKRTPPLNVKRPGMGPDAPAVLSGNLLDASAGPTGRMPWEGPDKTMAPSPVRPAPAALPMARDPSAMGLPSVPVRSSAATPPARRTSFPPVPKDPTALGLPPIPKIQPMPQTSVPVGNAPMAPVSAPVSPVMPGQGDGSFYPKVVGFTGKDGPTNRPKYPPLETKKQFDPSRHVLKGDMVEELNATGGAMRYQPASQFTGVPSVPSAPLKPQAGMAAPEMNEGALNKFRTGMGGPAGTGAMGWDAAFDPSTQQPGWAKDQAASDFENRRAQFKGQEDFLAGMDPAQLRSHFTAAGDAQGNPQMAQMDPVEVWKQLQARGGK